MPRRLISPVMLTVLLLFAVCLLSFPSSAAQNVCDGYTAAAFSGLTACTKDGKLHICENNFPDSSFRYFMAQELGFTRQQATENKILISQNVADAITEIQCVSKWVNDMQGIGFFRNLAVLNCNDNRLTKLDLSRNTKLTELNCGNNRLTSLIVNAPALEVLKCSYNRLTSLDSLYVPNLMTLECNSNELSRLSFSAPYLLTLECNDNALTAIHLTSDKLTTLSCQQNNLQQLDLTHFPALTDLNCCDNQLKQLDLSDVPKLVSLKCSKNKIEELDASASGNLIYLDCSQNALTTLNVSGNPALETLLCAENHLTVLDLGDTALIHLDCTDNLITSLRVPETTQRLHCARNRLEVLDLSHAVSLTTLNCESNRLTSLNLVNTTHLQALKVDNQNPQFEVECPAAPDRVLDIAALIGEENTSAVNRIFYQKGPNANPAGVVFNPQTPTVRLPDGALTLLIRYHFIYGPNDNIAQMTISYKVQCDHTWSAATCIAKEICRYCKQTRGEYAEHDWLEATRTEPRRCAYCNKKDGHPLEHIWQEATCKSPSKCAYCDETIGQTVDHKWMEATCRSPRKCAYCKQTEGTALPHTWLPYAPCETYRNCKDCGRTVYNKDIQPHTYVKQDCKTSMCTACGLIHYYDKENHTFPTISFFHRPRCLDCGKIDKYAFYIDCFLFVAGSIYILELSAAVWYLLDYKRIRKY